MATALPPRTSNTTKSAAKAAPKAKASPIQKVAMKAAAKPAPMMPMPPAGKGKKMPPKKMAKGM